jgi:tripeptide aminopeptidase
MNVEFLKDVLSLPSISGNESMVRDYIVEFARNNDIEYEIDNKGNVYLTKGRDRVTLGEYYPCVVSHIDTVHRSHIDLINDKRRLDIVENVKGDLIAYNPLTNEQTGIGGDDKCGVFVCLSLFLEMDILKGAFFVEEEIGMLGSREACEEFFKNVGYAIQFDAPSADWITEVCSGVKIFDSEFKDKIKPVLNEGGYTKFSNDPFTDVNQLSQKFNFNCLNLGCGYYEQHRDSEYVVVDEVKKSLHMGIKLIRFLGVADYLRMDKGEVESIYSTNFSNTTNSNYEYGNDEYYEEDEVKFIKQCDGIASEVVETVLNLKKDGYEEDIIVEHISDLLFFKNIFKD